MATLATLAARPAYSRVDTGADPNTPIRRSEITAAEATILVCRHLSLCLPGYGRSLRAEPSGSVILDHAGGSVRLDPRYGQRPTHLTQRQSEYLVALGSAALTPRLSDGRRGLGIDAELVQIPPGATERLVARGWVVTGGEHGDAVTLSVAGIVALAWRFLKRGGTPVAQWGDVLAESVTDFFTPEDWPLA